MYAYTCVCENYTYIHMHNKKTFSKNLFPTLNIRPRDRYQVNMFFTLNIFCQEDASVTAQRFVLVWVKTRKWC